MASILCVPFLILRLVTSILAVLLESPLRGRRARWTFRRTLRRAGLTTAEADALSDAYRPGLGWRDLARVARLRVG